MHILTILALSFSSNLDNLGVGVAFGARKTSLPFSSNLLIAVITSCGTLISMILGQDAAIIVRNQQAARDAGALIIVAVGLYLLLQSLRNPAAAVPPRAGRGPRRWLPELIRLVRDPSRAEQAAGGSIRLPHAAALGLALTLNNLPNGFAAGLLGLSVALTTISVFALSLLTLWIGLRVGQRFLSRLLRDWAGPAAGVMLALLGVYELFS
ncbi:MAG: hypothetical protein ACLQDL_05350 [Spirochaetia bacterium]